VDLKSSIIIPFRIVFSSTNAVTLRAFSEESFRTDL
jgi:hypothetical protein